MATRYREFDCTGCGENTATLDPDLIQCDDCRLAYLREDMPYPSEGDSCETCEDFGGSLEFGHFAAAEQAIADRRYARPMAPWGAR